MIFDFLNQLQERYGKHMLILDWALHLDEDTPHIHERHVFDVVNKYRERQPKQEDALKEYADNLTKENLVGWDKEITDETCSVACLFRRQY